MSSEKDSVFISSVQKELEPERLALFSLLTTDPFLKEHVTPVLFEKLPPPKKATSKAYLKILKQCDIYILMLDREYSWDAKTTMSATHEEYQFAHENDFPILVMVKGSNDKSRDPRTQGLFKQIKSDGYTYKRFIDRIDLKKEVSAWLQQIMKEDYDLSPTKDEEESGDDSIEATSAFESTQQGEVGLDGLDLAASRKLYSAITGQSGTRTTMKKMTGIFRVRGLLWANDSAAFHPTAGGIAFLGGNPALRFPQCQVQADAYRSKKVTSTPRAQKTFSGPIPVLIEQLIQFVQDNTEHPTRVVGINNIALEEYPEKAIREALVNAFAHRDYEDAARKIRLEVFQDRIVVSSPGYPPKPLTLAKLKKRKYESCRRNPIIAECLAALHLMEQRGTGFERIRVAMADHGLDEHKLDRKDGYFKITLPGPDGDFKRIRTPKDASGSIPPSVETQLNERQKKIMVHVQTEGSVTSGWCKSKLQVSYNTAYRDLSQLVDELGLLEPVGAGRSRKYVLKTRGT